MQENDVTFINIYSPNIEMPKNIQQILTDTKGNIDNNTIVGEDFNTSLSSMDTSSSKKSIRQLKS